MTNQHRPGAEALGGLRGGWDDGGYDRFDEPQPVRRRFSGRDDDAEERPKRSSTGRAAPAVPPFLRKPPAVAPQTVIKAIPAGTKTTSAPAAWLASVPAKPGMSDVPTLAPDGRIERNNAVAAVPWGGLSVLPANALLQEPRMPPSPPAAVQRRAVRPRTGDAPAPTRTPRATPGDPLSRPWRRTGPAATANPPAAHGLRPADHGTTAPASTTEPVASSAADPARQPGAGGLQRS